MPVTLSHHDEIALISINNPPVNAISQAVRAGLHDAVTTAIANSGVRGIVIACEGKTFIAGADVREFNRPPLPPHLGDVINQMPGADDHVVVETTQFLDLLEQRQN